MSDIGSRIRHLESSEYMLTYAGNPNGLLDAAETSLCYDTLTGNIYVNLDGVVSWALIGGGGGGGAPNSAEYLVLTLNGGLTSERQFVPAARLAATDLGANNTYTLDLAASGVGAGAYGSATQSPTFTVDTYGRLTLAANVAITGTPPAVHNVLDSTYHGDVLTGAITRGDLLYGNATPKIARLALGGIAGSVPTRNATDVLWSTWALSGTAAQTYTFPANSGSVATGAGTLTATTVNDVTIVNHTHAVTDTSDGDTTPSTILSTDANGTLRVRRLGVGAAAIAVNGTIVLPDAGYIGNSAATARMVLDSSGVQDYAYFSSCYVGINDTTPGFHLDVNGSIGINGVQTVYNAGALSASYTGTLYLGNGGGALAHGGGADAYYNTAGGTGALYSNTTGESNTAFGNDALYTNTTGELNSAFGWHSLYNCLGGLYNDAHGADSLYSLSSGSANAAAGLGSLAYITTTDGNVGIGYYSGAYISGGINPNQTGEYSVFIGYDTRALANGQANQIVIGANATGNGANTTTIGHTTITDCYIRGNVITENLHFVGLTGDARTVYDSTNGRIDLILGDAAGADEVRVIDSGAGVAATIDSDGNGYFAGNVGMNTTPNLSGFGADNRVLSIQGNAADNAGIIELIATDLTGTNRLGEIRFINKDGGAGVVSQAQIRAIRDGDDAAAALTFYTDSIAGGAAERMRINEAGNVGINVTTIAAKLHVDQASDTGAIPVITADQADVSEEALYFIGTSSAASADQTLVKPSDFPTPGALVAWLKCVVSDTRVGGIGTVDGWVPFYAIPT